MNYWTDPNWFIVGSAKRADVLQCPLLVIGQGETPHYAYLEEVLQRA